MFMQAVANQLSMVDSGLNRARDTMDTPNPPTQETDVPP